MKSSQFVLQRFAEVPVDDPYELEVLKTNISLLNTIIKEIESCKEQIISRLEHEIKHRSGSEKIELIKIKQKIYKERIKDVKGLNVDDLFQLLQKREDILTNNRIHFKNTMKSQEEKLFKYCLENENFKKALLTSSPEFYRELIKNTDRKKSLKGLIKYYYRGAYKTSPFSFLTTFNIKEVVKNKVLKANKRVHLSIDINVVKNCIYILNQTQKFINKIPLKVNSSIIKDGDELIYYCYNESENVKRMKISQGTSAIISFVQKKRKVYRNDLAKFIEENFLIDKPGDFIDGLFKERILFFDLKTTFVGTDALTNLRVFLNQVRIPEINYLIDIIIEIEKELELDSYNYTAEELRLHKQSITEKIGQILLSLLELAKEEETNQSLLGLIHRNIEIVTNNFFFKFYEDVISIRDIKIDHKALTDKLNLLGEFSRAIEFLNQDQQHNVNLLEFYNANYKGCKTIPLLKFFNDYNLNRPNISEVYKEGIRDNLNRFKELIKNSNFLEDAAVYNLDQTILNKLKEISPFWKNSNLSNQEHKAVFFHLFNHDNQQMMVINGFAAGFGKWFSRFTKTLSEANEKKLIQTFREQLLKFPNIIPVENIDHITGNANLHKNFLLKEIDIPGGESFNKRSEKIKLSDLYIKNDQHVLTLFHKPLNKTIQMFNFGFFSTMTHSNLFQTLDFFNPTTYLGVDNVTNLILENLEIETKSCVIGETNIVYIATPKITLNHTVILRRREWRINKDDLLNYLKKESCVEDQYLLFATFQCKLNIPDEVFIKISSIDRINIKDRKGITDHYKPFYINFKSPILFQHFVQLLHKADLEFVMVTEMLPDTKDANFQITELLTEFTI